MATTVQNFGVSSEKMEFTGSSEEDITHAKTFWQSVQLLPPMESRLVSNDINQRLKAATFSHQSLLNLRSFHCCSQMNIHFKGYFSDCVLYVPVHDVVQFRVTRVSGNIQFVKVY